MATSPYHYVIVFLISMETRRWVNCCPGLVYQQTRYASSCKNFAPTVVVEVNIPDWVLMEGDIKQEILLKGTWHFHLPEYGCVPNICRGYQKIVALVWNNSR